MAAAPVSISPRVQTIFQHRHDHYDRAETGRRDQLFFEALQNTAEQPNVLSFARGFANVLAKKQILIKEYDLLAGFSYRYTYEASMPIRMSADFDPQYRPSSSGDYRKEVRDCIAALGLDPQGEEARMLDRFAEGTETWLYKHWESGHILPGYERLFQMGFGGLLEEGTQALAAAGEARRPYVEAMLICNEAAGQYILRYAAMAGALAEQTQEPACRAHLTKMAGSLKHIAFEPPRSFFEAVQLLWLTHEMLFCESYPASFSFGRIDQYLYPFYRRDLERGAMTRQEAADYLDALWIKFSTTLHSYQNITLGGWDWEKNQSMCNEVTVLALQSSRKFKFEQPQVCFRYHENLSAEVWEECAALLATGTGFPAFFGDRACMENKMRLGIPEADAKNFGLIGCVEMGIPGREYGKTEVLRVNWAKVLALMLQGGHCTATGRDVPLAERRDLDSIKTFEEFYQWYQRELLHVSRLAADSINLLDRALVHCYPTPYLSVLMEGCYQAGMDVTGGGTVYNNTGIDACGMANAADSLAAIRQVVFTERRCTLKELAAACAADFRGWEELRRDLLACPKYGNDDDQADLLLADLIKMYGAFVDTLENPRGGKFQLGLYTVEDHAYMGQATGALPDGRRAGVSLANGLSPAQGRDTQGPTAIVNSLLKSDLRTASNGMVLDLKFASAFLDSAAHRQGLKALLDAYFRSGGVELQINVVDRATLQAAQRNPEEHRDLVVRVSGFSALFTTLMKTTQDEIIARTEYGGF